MYLANARLPHLLSPGDYFDSSRYTREKQRVMHPGWHLVGTRADMPRSGDFITCELFGMPVLVRNSDGEYHAAANICAHRHCLLTSKSRGNSPKLRCQYHGWEYDAAGRTTHIPQARLFAPLDQDTRPRLHTLRTALCGQLIFVSRAADGPSLADHLGEIFGLCAERFGGDWHQSLSLEPAFPANWKVAVENALESYHVPTVHAHTFKEDPGEARSKHQLLPQRTEFATYLPFSLHSRLDAWIRRIQGLVLQTIGEPITGGYRHVHCFPNLLFSFTDAISLVQCVLPTSPTQARSVVRQFGLCRSAYPAWKKATARVWGAVEAQIARQILKEDFRFYEHVQRGLQASEQLGMLGRCEERIHSFHHWLIDADKCDEHPLTKPFAAVETLADAPTVCSPDHVCT